MAATQHILAFSLTCDRSRRNIDKSPKVTQTMILNLFGKRKSAQIEKVYARIVAQARQPSFYAEYRVPDTLDGRFDLLVLHVILVLYRLKGESDVAREQGRLLSERFFTDMDRTLREMGVGDLSVPKRIKKMADAYFGRLTAYNAALDGKEDAETLAAVLDRNIFPDHSDHAAADALATYVRAAIAELTAVDVATILSGGAEFPDPGGFAPKGTVS